MTIINQITILYDMPVIISGTLMAVKQGDVLTVFHQRSTEVEGDRYIPAALAYELLRSRRATCKEIDHEY